VIRTYSLTDECGNTTNITQNILINDNVPPTADPLPDLGPFACYADIPPANINDVTGETDNCGGVVTVAFVSDGPNPGCNGTVIRTYSLTDECGNTANITQNILINDNVPPTADPLPDLGPFACYADIPPANINDVTGEADNCGIPTVTFVSDVWSGNCPRIITRTYQAVDSCGNTSTCIQIITVNDSIAPVITCPANVTVACITDVPAPDITQVIATDNCGTPTVTFVGDVWSGNCPRIITRTYQAVDSCGNTSTCTQIITVSDTIDPVIVSCAPDITLTANANCEIIVPDFTSSVVATDNCGIASITQVPVSGTIISPVSFGDTIVVTLFVADTCNNVVTCTANILIADNFPLAVDDDAGTTLEDTPKTIDVLINDSWGCDGPSSSPIFVATQPANGTAVVDDGGTPTDPTDDQITYIPNTNYYGPDSFTYTICDSDGDCSTATVIIQVIPVNDPPVTFNEFIELCQGSSITDSVWNGDYDPDSTALFTQTIPVRPPTYGSFVINASGTFTYTSDPFYFGNDTAVVAVCDNGIPGTACTNDTIFFTIDQLVISNANVDQELCEAISTVLIGNNPAPGTGNWTCVSGPSVPVIVPANSPVVTVTGLITSTTPYVFVYTIVNLTCTSTDTMTVTNYALPTPANAGADQDICAPTPTSSFMTGNTPVVGTGLWTQLSGPGPAVFADPTDPVTSVSNLIQGTYLFEWTITSGVCPQSGDTVMFRIASMALVSAGNDDVICETSSYTLSTASASNYVSLMWTTTGTGSFTDPTLLNATYTPSVADIASGSVTLVLTATSFIPCPPVSDSMVLSISRQALVNAGGDDSMCSTDPGYTLSAATGSFYTSLLWTTSGTGVFSDPTILNPVYFPSPADIAGGSVVLTVTATSTPPCADASDALTLTIVPDVIATAGPDTTLCWAPQITLSGASASNYSSIFWTHTGTGTLVDPTVINPVYIPGINESGLITFTLTAFSLPPCTDSIVDQMTMLIYPLPTGTLTLVSGNDNCAGDTVILRVDLTGTPPWNFTYTDGTSNYNVITSTTPYIIVTFPDSTITYTLIALSDANCTALPGNIQGSVTVNIHPLPDVEFVWEFGSQNYEIIFNIDTAITDLGAIGNMILWNFGDGTFGYDSTEVHLYPAPYPYVVTLTVTDTNGCSNSVTHIVNVPVAPHAFFASNSPVCLGQPTCFTDLSWVDDPATEYIATWIWDYGDGSPNDTVYFPNNPNTCHTYDSLGYYPVTLTVIDDYGYDDSFTDTIQILANPIASFSFSEACEDMEVQFTDNSFENGGGTIVSWQWNFGDPLSGINNTSDLQNPTHTFTAAGVTYNVTLIVTNLNGCTDTLVKQVYVRPAPAVAFTHDPACTNQPVTFVADTLIMQLDSIVSWSWDFGDGTPPQPNPITITHTYNLPGSYLVTLTVFDIHGCMNIAMDTLEVHPTPIANFSWNTPTCQGSAVQFTDQSYMPAGFTGYIAKWLWDFGDGTTQTVYLPNSPNVQHTYTGNTTTYLVTLTVWSNDSCSASIQKVLNLMPSPVADFSYSAVTCTGQAVDFTDLSQENNGGLITQWLWNFGDPGSGTDNQSILQNPSHTYALPGTYSVQLVVINANTCSDTIIKTLTINISPIADFVADTACLGSPTTFTDLSVANSSTILTYQWDFGDGTPFSSQQNPVHTYATPGVFNVTLTIMNSAGCVKDTTKAVLVNPLPIPAFSYTTPTCVGDVVQFTDLSTTPPGYLGSIVKWVWDFGDGTTQTIWAPGNPNVSHVFVGGALSHTVRLTVKTSDSCEAWIEHIILSMPSPVADFSYSSISCTSLPVQFSDLSQTNGGGSIVSWYWNFDDPGSGSNNTSTLQNPTHAFTTSGIFNVLLIVSNTSNCTDTIVKPVTVNLLPVAEFTADTACLGSATQFTDASVPNAAGIVSWSWNFGDGTPPSGQPNPAHVYAGYGNYTVTLTIINTNGCVSSISHPVLVRPLPVPEFTFSSNSCSGAEVQFTDLSTVIPGYSDPIRTWTWDFGDGTIQTITYPANPDVTHAFIGGAPAYIVRLTVTTLNGCSDFIEHTVANVPAPVANFGFPGSNCENQAVQFIDLSQTNGGGPIVAWLWNFDDPPSGTGNTSTQQNPVHYFTAPGSYDVRLIVTNTSGCLDTVIHTVTVVASPVANFSADTACVGSPTTFTDLSTTTAGTITAHFWDFGDGQTSTASNPTHVYGYAGIFNVTLTVTTSYGCENSVTKLVPVPAAPVALFASSSPTCAGDSVYFTDLSTTTSGYIISWAWNFGDGSAIVMINFPASPDVSHVYANPGIYNVNLTVVTSDGCTASKTSPVFIQAAPSANFGYSTLRCEQMPVQFNDLSQPNGGTVITAWLWNFDDPASGTANTSTLQNPTHLFTSIGTYDVRLIVTNLSGCRDTISKPVTINQAPLAQFAADTACLGSPTSFTDQSTANAAGIVSWFWNFGDPASGSSNTSTAQNPTHIFSGAGMFNVTLTVINSNSCEDDTVMQVSVVQKPVAMFSADAACIGSPTQFTDLSIAPGSSIIAWFWDFGDGTGTSNEQNPVYTYTNPGTYNVKLVVTNLNNCEDSVILPVTTQPNPVAAFTYTNFFCPAGQVNFQDQSQGEGGTITERLWIFEPGSTSTAPNPHYTFSQTDTTYMVTLIVTNSYGCKDTVINGVYVKPDFEFTFAFDTVCYGNTTHFYAQNLTPGDSLFYLTWDFGDPASGPSNISHDYNPVHTFTQAGTFIVKLKAWDWDNCVDSVYKTVNIKGTPQALFTSEGAPCDSTVQFTDQSLPGTGSTISKWVWNFGDGTPPQTILAPGPGNTSHVYALPGDYTVTLTVTNSGGCSDSYSALAQPLACLDAAFAEYGPLYCARTPITFSDSSSPVSRIDSWTWYWGDGTDTTYSVFTPTLQHSYPNAGTFIVKLIVRALVNTAQFTDTAAKMIVVHSTPEASFSNNTVCMNQITLFEDNSEPNGEAITLWNWNFGEPASGGSNTSTGPDPSHTYDTSGMYTVTLLVMNKFGCKDSIVKPVQVFSNPVARFTNTIACAGNLTYFFDQSLVADTANSYWLWNFGDPYTGTNTSISQDPAHRYMKDGTYNVRLLVEDYNGCKDTCDSTILVNPSPLSAFYLTENIDGIPGKIQLNNESEGASSFIWDFGNGYTSEEENPIVTYSQDGTYIIMLITSNEFNCYDTTYLKYEMIFKGLFIPNAFAPTSTNEAVRVFKPVGINLKLYHIQVFDNWGNLMWESSLLDSQGRPVESWNGMFNGRLMPQGTYMWKVNAIFIDDTQWNGSDIGKGKYGPMGTVSLIR
jgi:PKD repeat protein